MTYNVTYHVLLIQLIHLPYTYGLVQKLDSGLWFGLMDWGLGYELIFGLSFGQKWHQMTTISNYIYFVACLTWTRSIAVAVTVCTLIELQ